LEKLVRAKRSSLLADEAKSFTTLTPGRRSTTTTPSSTLTTATSRPETGPDASTGRPTTTRYLCYKTLFPRTSLNLSMVLILKVEEHLSSRFLSNLKNLLK
jgi:hypothetical protein